MLRPKFDERQIFTVPTIFSISQWLPFEIYDLLPKFPRYAPNPYLLSPLTFFYYYISWHNQYQSIFPHSKPYRMLRAISTNNLSEVIKLLEQGFPIDEPIEKKYWFNCLQIAAINNHYPLIEILLLRGANINKQDRWGNTPLHLAIINQNHEAIHSLIKNGSNPAIKNNYGFTAIDKAQSSPSIRSFIQNYKQAIRNFPRFRVKLKLEEKLKNPFWEQIGQLNIYSGKVRQHLMSKWQFDFTDHNTVEELLKNNKAINDLKFKL